MNIRTPIFGSLAAVGMFLASQAVFAQLPGSGGTLVDGDCTSTETFCAVLPICETLGAYCNYCSQAEERRNMACIGSTQDGCLWFGTVFGEPDGCGYEVQAQCQNDGDTLVCTYLGQLSTMCGRNYCRVP